MPDSDWLIPAALQAHTQKKSRMQDYPRNVLRKASGSARQELFSGQPAVSHCRLSVQSALDRMVMVLARLQLIDGSSWILGDC